MARDDDLQKRFEEAFGDWKDRITNAADRARGGPRATGSGPRRSGPRGPHDKRPGLPTAKQLGFGLGLPLLLVLGLLALFSSYYTVQPEEVGVVTRFGRYVRQSGPGLHLKWPWGIEHVDRVRTLEIHKEEFGFRTETAGVRTTYTVEEHDHESLMLTGDLNIADIEWIVQYRVSEPADYLFNVRNPEIALRAASEAVMREVVGDRSVTEVLTSGRTEVNILAEERLQEVLDRYRCGLRVETVKLQDVTPPDPVKSSFNEVNQARQEKEQTINAAWAAYNKVVPLAEGEALQMMAQAEGYATERTNRAKGEAQRFLSVQEEYAKAPEVPRQRLYLEMARQVLPGLERKILGATGSGSGPLQLLHLNEGGNALKGNQR